MTSEYVEKVMWDNRKYMYIFFIYEFKFWKLFFQNVSPQSSQGVNDIELNVEVTSGGTSSADQHTNVPLLTSTSSPENTQSQPPNECSEEEDGKAKLKSEAWVHFDRKKINGIWKAICNYCGKRLWGDTRNVTSHLKAHTKGCPFKRQERGIGQSLLNPNKKRDRIELGH